MGPGLSRALRQDGDDASHTSRFVPGDTLAQRGGTRAILQPARCVLAGFIVHVDRDLRGCKKGPWKGGRNRIVRFPFQLSLPGPCAA